MTAAPRRRRAVPALAAGLVLAALLAGCSSVSSKPATSSGAGGLSGSITVLAAASLTGTFTALGTRFEAAHPGTHVRFSFDGSSTLATQITQGAPADVFASASVTNMKTVLAAGDATTSTVFVTNTAEIATPPGNPAHITSLDDLARSSVKVALCDPAVPCGVVAATIFHNAGITVEPVSREANVKATLAKVEIDEVDAAIVYRTDVAAAGSHVTGVEIPADVNATTDYPIATLTHTTNHALAVAFVDYVLSPPGRAVLTAAGFGAP